MIPAPTKKQIVAAFELHAPGRRGPATPTFVRMDAETFSVRNLADKSEDPWVTTRVRISGGVKYTEIATAFDRGVHLDGRRLTGLDVQRFDSLLAAMPAEHARHSRAGELARDACAKVAMTMRDAHVRALSLSYSDSWGSIGGDVLDSDAVHGVLYEKPDGMQARVLVVSCPSTGRRYGLAVPAEHNTARDARRWVMRLSPDDPDPEIET